MKIPLFTNADVIARGLNAFDVASVAGKAGRIMLEHMRELVAEAGENNDRRARLAIEIFCYRAAKYIGSYLAAMNGADAVIFTGGIGENSPMVRELISERLSWLGIELDPQLNKTFLNGREGVITKNAARLKVFVIPTNEELLIARDSVRLVGQNPNG